ncbi:MAG TPA: adhesin, partial [Pasteurellaceae bacterium]|nr:adhesin [Pasteurellaceae bacterium]
MSENPNVARFEQAVADKDYELACTELLNILEKIDHNFGGIQNIDFEMPLQIAQLEKDRNIYFCTRMAVAISTLFSDPKLEVSESGTLRFFSLQRWLAIIFASSPYINADHVLQIYNQNAGSDSAEIRLEANKKTLTKFCILYFPESNLTINLDAIWEADPQICASLCFALQSPRFIGTQAAFSKRATILQWFPDKLAQLPNLNNVPSGITHDVYMHCSYDTAANKHWVKKALNQVLRRHVLEAGCTDRDVTHIGYRNGKPVMVVLLEHFHAAHSIYRTHSTSMIAARELFYLVGLGGEGVDQTGRNVFDEFHVVPGKTIVEKLDFIQQICDTNGASVFYMPSIGMDLLTIFASNLRYAPIQVIALGHPATTHSDFIEYVIVEDDYVGSPDCFSETLLRLPK